MASARSRYRGGPFARFGPQLLQRGFGAGEPLVQPFLLLLGLLRTEGHQPAFAPGDRSAISQGACLLAPGAEALPDLAWGRVVHRGGQMQWTDRGRRTRYPLAQQRRHLPGHRQRKEIAAAIVRNGGAGAQTRGFRIAHKQEVGAAQHADKFLPGRDIQRIIPAIAGQRLADQRDASRVERAERLLELEQVGALILAEAKAQQGVVGLARFGWGVIHIERGGVVARHVGGQGVGMHQVLAVLLVKCLQALGVAAQGLQQDAQPVISAFFGAEHPAGGCLHDVAMVLEPVLESGQAMLALLEHKGDEQHGELPIGQAIPFPMGLPMLVNGLGDLHLVHPG
jgi:hypothetical protein